MTAAAGPVGLRVPAPPLRAAPAPSGPRPSRHPAVSPLAVRRLQALVRVGAADDTYEREADDLARGLVTGTSAAGRSTGCACGCGGHCAAQRSPAGGGEPAPSALSSADLESPGAGRPLSPATRDFFESRLGRDLDAVRLHTGPRAAEVTDRLGAVAVTLGSDIWLGAGTTEGPSHVLAHELVHVVQQTGPPPAGSAEPTPTSTASPRAQRFLPYWEPADWGGTRTHNHVLPRVSRQGQIFVEAPIPNAGRTGADFDKTGIADLYDASTTIGVFFVGDRKPRSLDTSSRHPLRHNGNPYAHDQLAAPSLTSRGELTRVALAPDTVEVADLKPHVSLPAAEGPEQVGAYLAGIRLAASEVNEIAATTGGPTWSVRSLSEMSRPRLTSLVPAEFDPARLATSSEPERPLVLKEASRPVRPRTVSQGRLALTPDPVHGGVLSYVWIPSPGRLPHLRLPESVRRLGADVTARLIDPLRQPPVTPEQRTGRRCPRPGCTPPAVARDAAAEHAAPAPAPRRVGPLVGTVRRVARRVQRLQHDPFDYRRWQADHERLKQEAGGLERGGQLADARQAARIAEAHRAIETRAGIRLPALPEQVSSAGRAAERIDFWTSAPASGVARLRQLFGGLFVRVADAYERMRERFHGHLRTRSAPGGGGIAGAAVRVAFTVLRAGARIIIGRTLDVLRSSLEAGVRRKLESLVGEDRLDTLRERLAEIDQLRTELEQQAVDTAEQLVERVFGPYEDLVGKLARVQELVSDFLRIVNLVRWAARAIACASPPLIGCLWGLAMGVLEELAAVVVGTCWFQSKVRPLLLRVSFVRDLPADLARLVLDAMRRVAPAGLSDVFGEVSVPELDPAEVGCEPEGPGAEIAEAQRAVLELQERLGEERFQAWLELSRRVGVPSDKPLTVKAALEIADAVLDSGATAADLRHYADIAESAPERVPVSVRTFLEQMGAPQIYVPPVAPGGEAGGGEAGAGEGGAGGGGDGGGAGGAAGAEGRPTTRELENPERITWQVHVLSGLGPGDFKGHSVALRARLSTKVGGRDISITVQPLHARVVARNYVQVGGRRAMKVTLEITQRQVFAVAPPPFGRLDRISLNRGTFSHIL